MNPIISKLRKLNIEISLVNLKLKISSPKGVLTEEILNEINENKTYLIDYITAVTGKEGFVSLEKAPHKAYYPLSSPQKRLYFIQAFNRESLSYNMPRVVSIGGPLMKDKLANAFDSLLERHESLRTVFGLVNSEPVQIVKEKVGFNIEYFEAKKDDVKSLVKEFIRPFELDKGPLLRVGLIEITNVDHILIVDMHHIIADGASQEILINDFMALYNDQDLPVLEIQYKDFAHWQTGEQQQAALEEQKRFWLGEFSEPATAIDLPADFPRGLTRGNEGGTVTFELGSEETAKLRSIAEAEGATLFMVMLAVFNILLSKLSNTADITIGTPTAGRMHADLDKVIGVFINTIPLRNYPKGAMWFREFLTSVKSKVLACLDNQHYPYEALIDALHLEREPSRNPLFDVMFAYENFAGGDTAIPGLVLKPVENDQVFSKFDLTLTVAEKVERLVLTFEYATALFKAETIEKFSRYLQKLITAVISDTPVRIKDIEILPAEEIDKLLNDFNATETVFDGQETILSAFEKVVKKCGAFPAIVFEGQVMSYRELDDKSTALAGLIRQRVKEREAFVGILIDRSPELIVGIIAVLKSGCAYVPLDPNYPIDRIRYIAADSQMKVVLTDSSLQEICNQLPDGIVKIDVASCEFRKEHIEPFDVDVSSSHLAYLIYTSGSTGNPKGVMVEHGNVVNFVSGISSRIPFPERNSILCLTTVSFDIFVLETIVPLLNGWKIVLASSAAQKDINRLSSLIKREQVGCLQMTPTHLKLLLSGGPDTLNEVAVLMIGGEAFPPELLKKVQRFYAGKIFNMYGPTETTVWSTVQDLTEAKSIDIGMPLSNTNIRILDAEQKLQAIGVRGELCIGGKGVARGYWRNQELTEEKFIPDPFQEGERLYRTGDMAKWLPDGNIAFIGRVDNQVKINGHRIELAEIESHLLTLELVQEVAVIAKEIEENTILVAFYVAPDTQPASALQDFLMNRLPSYMVPSYFVHLNSLPLTPNGKLDRKALPDPQKDTGKRIVPPANEIERNLRVVWANVLRSDAETVSVESSFFDLGGHSILAIKLINLIQNSFGANVGLPDFFRNPTIRGIAKKIGQADSYSEEFALPALLIDEENRYAPFPLTDVQQAYWIGRKGIFEFGSFGTHIYAEYFTQALDVDRFNKALQHLISRHEMLRMVVTKSGEQKILKDVTPYKARVLDLDLYSEENGNELFYKQREELSHQVFSGEQWPLFDVRITRFRDDSYKIHYSMDALIMDAGSSFILLEEFNKLYEEPTATLPSIEISFRDYVLSEMNLRKTKLYERSKQYWLDRVESLPSGPELPLNTPDANRIHNKFQRRQGGLDNTQWNILQGYARALGITPAVLLIGCFSEVLETWSKSSHFTLNLTLFNRIPFHADVDILIGDFTSLTLLEIDFRKQQSFAKRLQEIQQRMWRDLEHKYFSGVEVQREMSHRRGNTVIMPVVITSTLGVGNRKAEVTDAATPELDDRKQPYSITQTPQVWLDFQISENANGLWYNWDSVEGLFPPGVIDDMFSSYNNLLMFLIADEDLFYTDTLVNIPARQQEERISSNATSGSVSDKLLHELFIDQAEKNRGAMAIETRQKNITYGELLDLSAGVGHRLRALGVKPNKLVGIVMDKGWEQVVASMGILFSGAAYLPIDAELPQERVDLLLDQGDVEVVLTTPEVVERISFSKEKLIVEIDDRFSTNQKQNPRQSWQAIDDLAYVIFTSGSTGTPKGVMIDHRGAVNTILDINERFNVTANDKVFGISSLSFDLSVYDIFGVLAAGGTIVLPGKDEAKSPDAWMNYIANNQITLWNSVPAFMQMLVEHAVEKRERLPLRLVMMSGDWIPVSLPGKIRSLNDAIEIMSLGGATEASIWSIYYPVREVGDNWNSIPYGRPLKNQSFHVLKADLGPCPDYVPGDLYIGGIGLAKGYWKDAEKTNSKFITHPVSHERLYQTGDIGRYFADGNIEFLGREDSQVKIQGYRIELGEIEEALKRHADVQHAVVVAVANESAGHHAKRLVAYVVRRHTDRINHEDSIGRLTGSPGIITDSTERKLFKLAQHGIRAVPSLEYQVRLPRINKADTIQLENKVGKSYRFSGAVISLEEFSGVFDALLHHQHSNAVLPKYYYPSAGSLYPVQTYVYIGHNAVKDVCGGYYYYNPGHHRLDLIKRAPAQVPASERPGLFKLYLIADLKAIRPLYGDLSAEFCFQEAGHMANLLTSMQGNLALISDTTCEESDLFEHFSIDAAYTFIQGFTGGLVVEEQQSREFYVPFNIVEEKSDVWISLPHCELAQKCEFSYLSRKSYRTYDTSLVTLKGLSVLLTSMVARSNSPLFKDERLSIYIYAKPGRLEGVEGGYYYYDPSLNALGLVQSSGAALEIFSGNENIYENSGFGIFILGRKTLRSSFTAGYLAQSMMNISPAHEIGLCTIGTIDLVKFREILKCSHTVEVVYSCLGGSISPDQIETVERYQQSDSNYPRIEQEIKQYLAGLLPAYMIPGQFIEIEKVPLNSNGKVDKKALPVAATTERNIEFREPATNIEKQLAEIWAGLLNIEVREIGMDSDFFELGGHSLLGIRVINRLNEYYNIELGMQDIFSHSRLRELSGILQGKISQQNVVQRRRIPLAEKKEYYPVSFAQRRIIYSLLMFKAGTSYNSTSVYIIEGDLDIVQLEDAFNQLIARYEIFRTSFHFVDGLPVQRIENDIKVKIHVKDLRESFNLDFDKFMEEEIEKFIQPFDLRVAPLFKISLVVIADRKSVLLFDIDHSIVDKTSHDYINREFIGLFRGHRSTNVPVQYKDFASWQYNYFSKKLDPLKERYWLNEFKTVGPQLQLPTDYPYTASVSHAGEEYSFDLGVDLTKKIVGTSHEHGVTLYVFLLTAFKVMLYKLTGQTDISIGMPYTDRNSVELEEMVGILLNTIVIRSYPEGKKRFSDFLKSVNHTALKGFENGDYPFEMLLHELKYKRIEGRNPLFEILFNSRLQGSILKQPQTTRHDVHLNTRFIPYHISGKASAFDMGILTDVVDSVLHFTIQYKIDLFKSSTISYFMSEYQSLLRQIVGNPQLMLDEYSIFDTKNSAQTKIRIVNPSMTVSA